MTEQTDGGTSGWKPRFPVARIKKIMQADEDVGKVAQVTPVAVSKALELFMDRIIKAVAEETKARGARRVTPSHFKQIISTQKQYDFLESLTTEIPLPPSRPSTPPPTAPSQPRRRRKQSPSDLAMPSSSSDAPPKRKRRSPQKETFDSKETLDHEPQVKNEEEDNKVKQQEVKQEEHRRSGWFDIVMGDANSDEDDSTAKRRRAVKDEDEDYVS